MDAVGKVMEGIDGEGQSATRCVLSDALIYASLTTSMRKACTTGAAHALRRALARGPTDLSRTPWRAFAHSIAFGSVLLMVESGGVLWVKLSRVWLYGMRPGAGLW